MKPKIYYLATCSTCKRIMAEAGIHTDNTTLQNIKEDRITASQLDELKDKAGSYEALFSKKAQEYTARGLKHKELSEEDYRKLILEEYTFLKRPVTITDDHIVIGNSKEAVAKLKELLQR